MANKDMADDATNAFPTETSATPSSSPLGDGVERAVELARAELRAKGLTEEQIDAYLNRPKARDIEW
jgi:hypothetical protein